jgi:hypothetical protein
VAGHIFQARPVWIYTQSNITNFIHLSTQHQHRKNLGDIGHGIIPVPIEALWEAKETRGENGEPLVTSIANPASTPDLLQNLNLACDWPFVKISQTGLGNKHYFYIMFLMLL